jgi:hypothetical protein
VASVREGRRNFANEEIGKWIMELQRVHQVRRAEDEISQNGSEKTQNWLHSSHNSFCDAARIRKSGTIGVQQRNYRVAEVPRS